MGIQFTASQEDQIKTLVESGRTLEAQKVILKELDSQFAGSAAAQATNTQKMRVAFENLAESVGGLIGPAIEKAAGAVAKFVTQVQTGQGAGGQFRNAVVGIGSAVSNLATSFGPTLGSIGELVLDVGKVAVEFAQTEAAVVAFGAVIGGLVGRMAGLAAGFAIGKVVAFVGAIKAAGSAVAALNVAISRNPVGLLATVIGTVVGALIGLRGSSSSTKITTDQLNESLRRQADAMRAVRDIDIDVAQRKANVKSATAAVAAAEQNLTTIRGQFGAKSIQAKQAEADLTQAKVNMKRATRDLGDVEEDSRRKREDATRATDDARAKTRQLIEQKRDELELLRGGIRYWAGTADQLAKNKQNIKLLRGEIALLENKRITITAALKMTSSDPIFKVPKGGFGAGLPLEETIMEAAARKGMQNGKKAFGGALGAAAGGFGTVTPLAAQLGLGVTSGYRPGDPGWHGKNRARDYGGSAGSMKSFAWLMARTFGSRLLELIHTPLGFGIKNGRRVGLGFWGSKINADHYDHVHVAMRRGGMVPGAGVGDRVPAMLEPGEFVMRKKIVEQFGPTFFTDLNERVARFQKGGLVGKLVGWAKKGGFRGKHAAYMAAIGMAESGGNVRARNKTSKEDSRGWPQINTMAHPWARGMNLYNPVTAAKAAYRVYRQSGRSFGPWTTWPGRARQFIPAALAALEGAKKPTRGGGGGGGTSERATGRVPNLFGNELERRAAMREFLANDPGNLYGGLDQATRAIGVFNQGNLFGTPQQGAAALQAFGLTPNAQGQFTNAAAAVADVMGDGTDPHILTVQAALAKARLTQTLDDDLYELSKLEQLFAQRLGEAEARGDFASVIQFAGDLKGVRDEIASLNDTAQQMNKKLQAQLDLEKEKTERLNRSLATSQTELRMMRQFIAGMVSGEIGGRVGLGSMSPSAPGRFASY